MDATTSTFALIKPRAVRHHLIGNIVTKIEEHHFTIRQLETRELTYNEVQILYAEHKKSNIYDGLVKRMLAGPVVIMKLEYTGPREAWKVWRELIGNTNPSLAHPGTIRKIFGTSTQFNAVHGSDSRESAQREINIFFNK